LDLRISKERQSVSNLRKEMPIKSIDDSFCINRLMWLGRLTRMDGKRLVSRVWGAECHGKRAPGDNRQNYQTLEGKDLAKAGVSRVDALKKVGNVEISDPVDDPM
jgi:hypothetical protein